MSATGKRGADRLNMIGVVVVGICGAVLTYVSIILLEAFYMNDTSAVDRDRAHENPNSLRTTVRAAQLTHIGEYRNGATPDARFLPIERAMELVVADAQKDPSTLVPAVGPSTKPDMLPQYGRPVGAVAPAAGTTEPALSVDGVMTGDGAAPGPPAVIDGSTPPTGTVPTPTKDAVPPAIDPSEPAPRPRTAPPPKAATKRTTEPTSDSAQPAAGGDAQ